MASVTRTACGADNGKVHIDYTFDDQSLLLTGVSLHNDGTTAGTVIAQVFNPQGALLFTDTLAIGAGASKAANVSPLGIHMVNMVGRGGVSVPQLPGTLVCTFTPGR